MRLVALPVEIVVHAIVFRECGGTLKAPRVSDLDHIESKAAHDGYRVGPLAEGPAEINDRSAECILWVAKRVIQCSRALWTSAET